MGEKPPVTKTTHPLAFKRLSPVDFERLCLWLIGREGYEDAEHFGIKGSDEGRDVVAWRDGRRVVFQCKRVKRFKPAEAEQELSKLLKLPPQALPQEVVFIVTASVTAETRDRATAFWGDRGSCHFWAGTELDEKVKRHPEILREFFELKLGMDKSQLAETEPSGSQILSVRHLDSTQELRSHRKEIIVGFALESVVSFVDILFAPRAFFTRLRSVKARGFLKAVGFALSVSIINLIILTPLNKLLGVESTLSFLAVDTVITFGFWIMYAVLLHLAVRLVGGSGSGLATMASALYLTAYTPLLLLLSRKSVLSGVSRRRRDNAPAAEQIASSDGASSAKELASTRDRTL